MGATPVFKWPWPEDTLVANAATGLGDMAKAVENEFKDTGWLTYTPEWRAAGSQQPANAAITARYKVHRGWCDVNIVMTFGSSVFGGRGVLTLTVPVTAEAHMLRQYMFCKVHKSSWGGAVFGVASITGGSNILRPVFPATFTTPRSAAWQSADSTGAAGTGIPAIAGAQTVAQGGNFVLNGRFKASG